LSIREKIDAVNNSFVQAFNSGDISKAMEVYTSTATILPPNAPMMHGKEAITAFWKGAVEMGVKEAQLETVKVTPMGKDAVCEVGNYVLKIQPEGAPVVTDKGKYLMIWKLSEGVWKWDTDAWNSSLPPP
jgi:ketosteroid isomerase-like protein